jgi:hypothetical protein
MPPSGWRALQVPFVPPRLGFLAVKSFPGMAALRPLLCVSLGMSMTASAVITLGFNVNGNTGSEEILDYYNGLWRIEAQPLPGSYGHHHLPHGGPCLGWRGSDFSQSGHRVTLRLNALKYG